ncbi:hypothetical protein [Massilia putida]|uniref:hypothetical protein n=1 Tax=Massilia putida TaxID=1141883 RepID=UPI0009533FD5|nr:hypothetical protein [Massilia putida]
MTVAAGPLHNREPWAGSLIGKRTGAVHQSDADAATPAAYDTCRAGAYTSADLAIAYRFANPGLRLRMLKVQLDVFNVSASRT